VTNEIWRIEKNVKGRGHCQSRNLRGGTDENREKWIQESKGEENKQQGHEKQPHVRRRNINNVCLKYFRSYWTGRSGF
jgi:hypothetical protein